MISRIKRLIRRSVWALTKQLEKSDFIPGGYELKFEVGRLTVLISARTRKKIVYM